MADLETLVADTRFYGDQHPAPATPAASTGVSFASNSKIYYKNAAGTEADLTGGGGVTHDFNVVTGSADISVTSTSWGDLDNNLDCTVAAVAGDTLEISMDALCAGTDPILFVPEMVTSGNQANGGASNVGPGGWYSVTGTAGISGTTFYTVVSGDISGGNVQVRLQVRLGSGTSRTVNRNSWPIHFGVKNLG